MRPYRYQFYSHAQVELVPEDHWIATNIAYGLSGAYRLRCDDELAAGPDNATGASTYD
jgi:hypothetical protein